MILHTGAASQRYIFVKQFTSVRLPYGEITPDQQRIDLSTLTIL